MRTEMWSVSFHLMEGLTVITYDAIDPSINFGFFYMTKRLLSWGHSILRCWQMEILKKCMNYKILLLTTLQILLERRKIFFFSLELRFSLWYTTSYLCKRRMRVRSAQIRNIFYSHHQLYLLTWFPTSHWHDLIAPNQDILGKRTISMTKTGKIYWKSE